MNKSKTKNGNRPNKHSANPDEWYVLVWKTQFTLLEDFILQILENKGGATDEEIAKILCLQKSDIECIIKDDGLRCRVQGDHSRRTLTSGFTKKEWNLVDDKGREQQPSRNICDAEFINCCNDHLISIGHEKIPAKLKHHKAEKYYRLALGKTGGDIPESLKRYFPTLFFEKKK